MGINKRLLQYVRSMRIYMLVVVGLSLLTGLLTVLQAGAIAQVINAVFLVKQTLPQVMALLIVLLLVIIGRAVLVWCGEATTNFAACHVKSDLRQRLFAQLLKLGPLYVKGERSGEIVNTVTEGVEALDAYFSLFFPQLCATILIPVIILVVVFSIDPLSGIILLVTLPILPFFMVLIGKYADAMTRKRWNQLGQMSAHFLDVLQGLTTLKLFGRTQAQQATIRQVSERFGAMTLKVLSIAFLSSLVMEMGATISTALIAVEIGLRLLYGTMPFEQAFFILLLTPEFYQPLRSLGTQFHASMNSSAGAERIFAILETPVSLQQTATPRETEAKVQHELRVNAVHYSYSVPDSANRPALQDVSFSMQMGQKIALVGPVGAGKSTLAHLLLRFIEPEQGEITADGVPITAFSAQDWRKLVAWQPQRPYLFDATVAENIRLGCSTATLEEVMQAAQQANIHEFIQSLPEGYDTQIGERGTRLSGGQAQRLSLARAFLKRAPLLILDEATSTLDPESEAQVLKAIDNVMKDRIVLVIAHRLNTISAADKVVVMQAGHVVGCGTHQSLQRDFALYQTLLKAFTDEGAVI